MTWYLLLPNLANQREDRNIQTYCPIWSSTSNFWSLSSDHPFHQYFLQKLLLQIYQELKLLPTTFKARFSQQLLPTIQKCFPLWLRAQSRPLNSWNTFSVPILWLHLNIRPCRGTFWPGPHSLSKGSNQYHSRLFSPQKSLHSNFRIPSQSQSCCLKSLQFATHFQIGFPWPIWETLRALWALCLCKWEIARLQGVWVKLLRQATLASTWSLSNLPSNLGQFWKDPQSSWLDCWQWHVFRGHWLPSSTPFDFFQPL